jgi:hypothetical protein
METNWTKAEFKAYLLAYCAQTDYIETEEEKDFILELVSSDAYKSVKHELKSDNDYQSIQKIQYNIEKFNYSDNEIETLLSDIKNLFIADGEVDILETNLFRALQKIIKN